MKLKYLTTFLFLLVFQCVIGFQGKSICSCELLKESKENDKKVSAIAQEIVNAIKKSLTKIILDLLALDKDRI